MRTREPTQSVVRPTGSLAGTDVEDLLERCADDLLRDGAAAPAPRQSAAARARPASRPEKMQPPRNVPSRDRYPWTPPPPNPAASPAA